MTHPIKRVTCEEWHRAYVRLSAALRALMATPWTEDKPDDDEMFEQAAKALSTAAEKIERITKRKAATMSDPIKCPCCHGSKWTRGRIGENA